MSVYTAHLANDERPDYTACGEPWQGWQAPQTDSYELTPGNVELPPHYEPQRGDTIRQCQACARSAIAVVDESPASRSNQG